MDISLWNSEIFDQFQYGRRFLSIPRDLSVCLLLQNVGQINESKLYHKADRQTKTSSSQFQSRRIFQPRTRLRNLF